MDIKIFNINDYEWLAGSNWEETKSYYLDMTGISEEEAFDEPYELSNEEMSKLKFFDDDGSVRSFKEELDNLIERGQEFPCLFAAVDY